MFAEQKRAGAVLLAGLEHLDDRYLKAVGYATKSASAAACRRWCCSATSPATTPTPWRAPRREVVRIANSRSGEGFVADQRRGAQEVLARPQAHRGHQQAHQRLQDQRGRGDPAAAHGRVHRRHRAHQHRAVACQQARAGRRAGGVLRARQPAAGQAATTPARSPSAELLEDRVAAGAGAACARCAALWRGWLRPIVGRRPLLPAAAGPHAARQLEDADPRAAAGDLRRRRVRADPGRVQRDPPARAARAASGSRCTCTPATATCTPTSRSTATTTRCCRPRMRR